MRQPWGKIDGNTKLVAPPQTGTDSPDDRSTNVAVPPFRVRAVGRRSGVLRRRNAGDFDAPQRATDPRVQRVTAGGARRGLVTADEDPAPMLTNSQLRRRPRMRCVAGARARPCPTAPGAAAHPAPPRRRV